MRLLSISFLVGILSIQPLTSLPRLRWFSGDEISPYLLILVTFTLLVVVFSIRYKNQYKTWKIRPLIGLIFGCLYVLWAANSILSSQLPASLEGNDIIVNGTVASIPYPRKDGWRFKLKINEASSLNHPEQVLALKGTLRLGWYRTKNTLKAGQKWRLVVRLKRPAGFMNFGGFDYEKWLFQQRIVGTGYIRKSSKNKLLADSSMFSVDHYREAILQGIQQRIKDPQQASIVAALAVADRSAITDQQWQILRQTGTNHLIAISGLHIGMVAGFGFFPVMIIWWLFPSLYQKMPVRMAGGIVGAIFAVSYALLAGFTLPTQRALIMVLVVLFGLLARRHYSSSNILATALLAVLIYDPLAVLSQGFWLSFVAVGLIMFTVARRIARPSLLMNVISIQLVLSFGMLPLMFAFFGVGSLSSPLANLIAIPWVTVVVVPLTLLGVLMLPFTALSSFLLNLAGDSVSIMMNVLEALSSSAFMISLAEVPWYLLVLSFVGFIWLWLPSKFPARWLGALLILPAILYRTEPIEQGAFKYDLLDVGQGLASVIRTKNHVLIYDTGPRASASFDTGKLVVLPFLKANNISYVDTLILSHEDMDHRGGTTVIRQNIDIGSILSSDTTLFEGIKHCDKGMKWSWDEVEFEMLSPLQEWQGSENDRSCVLRVSNKNHSLLLTGDIEKIAEKQILSSGVMLKSEVMTIPHHASKTSSSEPFIDAVQPELALATTGYRNRFHFPNKQVVSRYQQRNISVMTTAQSGAISLYFPPTADAYQLEAYRDTHQHYWNKKSISQIDTPKLHLNKAH